MSHAKVKNRYIPLILILFISFGFNAQGAVMMEAEQAENTKGEPYLVEDNDSPTPSYKVLRSAPDRMGAGQGSYFDEVEAVDGMIRLADASYHNARKSLHVIIGVCIFVALGCALLLANINAIYAGIPE